VSADEEFWEQPEVVQRFAARDPDLRLQALLGDWDPSLPLRALDVGCAGGRNTVLLAQRGWDVLALDASTAMVRATRRRLAAVLGKEEAHERVRRGRMDALPYPDADFSLVLSLGVLHIAGSWAEWSRAADEIARVLRPGGCFLVSQFTPDSRPGGEALAPVAGEAHVFGGYSRDRSVLLDPPALDAELQRRGLTPLTPPVIATGTTERGQRVSVNGLYRK
jgi:SAM-dependent methyltransferase